MITMFKQKPWKKLFSVLLCVAIVFGALSFLPIAQVSAKVENPIEEYNRLKKEQQKIAEQIKLYEGRKDSAVALRKVREEEKIILDQIIVQQQQKITDTQTTLEAKEIEVANKRQSIFDNDLLLQKRLVAMYKQNVSSVLSSLLSVDDFAARNVLADGLQRVSVNDTALLVLLSTQKTALEQEEAEIQTLLAQLEADYTQMEADIATLAENIAALNNQISANEASVLANKQAYSEKELEAKEAEKAMKEFINSLGGSNSNNSEYVGGAMSWPLSTRNVTITTRFGQKGHGGMDFSTNHATNVNALAAADGVIIQAGWHEHKYSYGNYVVIDHGGGVRTLYAHLDSIKESSGSVTRGTAIGVVGTTGYSFGIHLHFEVHLNGVRQNPDSWLKG